MSSPICHNDITDIHKVITELNHVFHMTCMIPSTQRLIFLDQENKGLSVVNQFKMTAPMT